MGNLFDYFILLLVNAFASTHVVFVHIENRWTGSELIAPIINEINWEGEYTIVATDDNWKQSLLLNKVDEDKVIISRNGFYETDSETNTFIITGGYFRACMANVMRGLSQQKDRIYILPMRAIVQGHTRTLLDHKRENYPDDQKFLDYMQTVARVNFDMPDAHIVLLGDNVIISN